jgi:Uri superfamily endonuclease
LPNIEEFKCVKGLYILLIELEPGKYRVGRFFEGVLPGGLYIYIGSAWGRGGLAARVSRHLKKNKRKHWHIDWITSDERTRILKVYFLPRLKGEERLYRALEPIGECIVPGFGSSDTRGSKCHFLKLKTSVEVLEAVIHGFYPDYTKISI